MFLIQSNFEKNISLSTIDFDTNFKTEMKLLYWSLCFLKDVQFHRILFPETTLLFSHYALLLQLVMQLRLVIDKIDTEREVFTLNMLLKVAELYICFIERGLRYCLCFRN